jgi:hypothetical protein
MPSAHGPTILVVAAGLFVIAFVIGAFRRHAGLRRAQALAPDAFVFRFSMWGAFGTQLPKLPREMLVASRSGKHRVAAVLASDRGIEIWQVSSATPLAKIDWPAVVAIYPSLTRAGYAYPTVMLEVADTAGGVVTIPLMSANSAFFWPRTSRVEVKRIVARRDEMRKGRPTPAAP